MVVFTLPSFPYVFKMIRDHIAPPKSTTREKVQSKSLLVKQHERVGRMSDSLEFSDVAFPKSRFEPKLLEELRTSVPSQLEESDDEIIIKHVYIERRVTPLDLFIKASKDEQETEHAIIEFGNTIKELASANIFPGDMLWKNFGVTRFGRVIFYDYDEIEYLTDCNFRRIPPPPYPEYETLGEPWFSVGIHDIFPEEFVHFIIGSPKTKEVFMKHHEDLLTPEYWWGLQEQIKKGLFTDFFPYSQSLRFRNVFPDREESASTAGV
jgi:isocitrate dehydrogenase kinase/phosphatase